MVGSSFAPIGELVVLDDGQRVVCHLCGEARSCCRPLICARHGWTAEAYREAFGLSTSTALCTPAVTAQRRELGLARYRHNKRPREGLAVGQQMARSGELLALSHAAQPVGSARTQTRLRATERAAARDTVTPVALRVEARLAELGFPGDLRGYLRHRYDQLLLPALTIARELGVGNARIQVMLNDTGIHRRRPGGAGAAPRPDRRAGPGHAGADLILESPSAPRRRVSRTRADNERLPIELGNTAADELEGIDQVLTDLDERHPPPT